MQQISFKPFTAAARHEQFAAGEFAVTTIRKGTKWLQPELIGQTVELYDEGNHRVFATARVRSAKVRLFGDVSSEDYEGLPYTDEGPLEMIHDDVLDVMKQVYGDSFSDDTLVTVLCLDSVNYMPANAELTDAPANGAVEETVVTTNTIPVATDDDEAQEFEEGAASPLPSTSERPIAA